MNAKEFSSKTGFPLAMIRYYCRSGLLSHWTRGKVYLINAEDALEELNQLKDSSVHKNIKSSSFKSHQKHTPSVKFDYYAKINEMKSGIKK